jgi:hypothetical protein
MENTSPRTESGCPSRTHGPPSSWPVSRRCQNHPTEAGVQRLTATARSRPCLKRRGSPCDRGVQRPVPTDSASFVSSGRRASGSQLRRSMRRRPPRSPSAVFEWESRRTNPNCGLIFGGLASPTAILMPQFDCPGTGLRRWLGDRASLGARRSLERLPSLRHSQKVACGDRYTVLLPVGVGSYARIVPG